ncbi:TspO/MBR family protein [Nonomuraea sp. NPDC004580]|uniref:TspO/MBR family protein n=1 Tax=Nonomuraea sp. NPDC004580 TaxID=3154552 RepID=UPI0033BA5BE5
MRPWTPAGQGERHERQSPPEDRTRTPKLALAEILVLNASNALLIRRTWPADRRAALALLPYAGWTVFATALNTAIARRNP